VVNDNFERMKDWLANLAVALDKAIHSAQMRDRMRMEAYAQHLIMLDPTKVLARGYSIVQHSGGGVVSDASKLDIGADIDITFAKGWAIAEVRACGVACSHNEVKKQGLLKKN